MKSKDLHVMHSGERTNAAGKPVSNLLLLSTSDSDYSFTSSSSRIRQLPNHLVLHEAGGKLEFAYFPNRGLISLVVVMKDGKTAEAGIRWQGGFYRNTSGCWPEQEPACKRWYKSRGMGFG